MVAIARRPKRSNFAYHGRDFWRDGGYRPHDDGTTKFCLQLETNPRGGGLLLRCSMVATVFRGDRSDGPYLTRFGYHGTHFLRDGGYRPHDDRRDAKRCGPTENDPDPPPRRTSR